MKKLLKFSSITLLMIASLWSKTALACQTNDPHYHACVYHNHILLQQQQQNSGYYESRQSGGIVFFLGLAWDAQGQPFFWKQRMRGPVSPDHEGMQKKMLAECNNNPERNPCTASVSTYMGCIAIAQSDNKALYASAENTCKQAKQEAIRICQADPQNPHPKSCKKLTTKYSVPFWF